MSAGIAAITSPASPSQQLTITVSNEPACLAQLHTVATTGTTLTAATTAASSSGSGSGSGVAGLPTVQPSSRARLTWQAQQQLAWEDSTALVLSYARFTDGAVMDVTDKTALAAVVPAGATLLPFILATDNTTGLSWISVNITVSS